MWARELLNVEDPAYLQAGRAAFNTWERAATNQDIPVATSPRNPAPATIAAWAMIHGYARLTLDGALKAMPASMQRKVLSLLPKPNE